MSTRHSKAAEAYLNNDAVVNRHDQTFFGVRQKRDRMAQGLPEWERLREAASQIKKHTATHLADYLELFEKNATKNGVHVHWAQDAEEYNSIVARILKEHNVTKVVKSKSMLTEECHLNEHLEQIGIEVVETEKIRQKQATKEKIKKMTKPYLLTRVLAGLLDLVFLAILSFSLAFLSYGTIFKSIGYFDYIDTQLSLTKESGLFVEYKENAYVSVDRYSQEYSVLVKEYDSHITYYYSNDQVAIKENRLESFNEAKAESTYFIYQDGKYILNEDASHTKVLEFYNNEYTKAIELFNSNETYINASIRSYRIVLYTIFIVMLIATISLYIIIPLFTKEGETLGYLIFKLAVIDSRDASTIKRWQVIMRGIAFIAINFIITYFIYFMWQVFMPITPLVSLVFLIFINRGPHDFMSYTKVVLKRRSDAMDSLSQMVKGGTQ